MPQGQRPINHIEKMIDPKKFANRKVDEYMNKKGERENKKNGPIVEKLSDKYGYEENDSVSK